MLIFLTHFANALLDIIVASMGIFIIACMPKWVKKKDYCGASVALIMFFYIVSVVFWR